MLSRNELVVTVSLFCSYLHRNVFDLCFDVFELSSKFVLDELMWVTQLIRNVFEIRSTFIRDHFVVSA